MSAVGACGHAASARRTTAFPLSDLCQPRRRRPLGIRIRMPLDRIITAIGPSAHAVRGHAFPLATAIGGMAATTAARGVRLLTAFRLASASATGVCRCRQRLKEAGPCEGSRNPAPRRQPASLRGRDRRWLRDRRDHACDPDERTPVPRRGCWQPLPADKVALARVGMKRDLGRCCATNAQNCGPASAV